MSKTIFIPVPLRVSLCFCACPLGKHIPTAFLLSVPLPAGRRLRTLGSAALHMCFCAAGSIDAHFTVGIHIWDIAAGYLIVREAGGVVIDTGGWSHSH